METNDDDAPAHNDLFSVGKALLPIVAIAAAGSAAIGVAALLAKAKKEKPTIDHALKDFPVVSAHMGKSAAVQRLLYFACICPDWSTNYFGECEQIIMIFGNFHLLVDNLEHTFATSHRLMEDMKYKVSAASKGDVGISRGETDGYSIEDWCENVKHLNEQVHKTKYQAASMLEEAMLLRQSIVVYGAQFKRIVRAFNIYWDYVGKHFLTHVNLADIEINPKTRQLIEVKKEMVSALRNFGLDCVLKHGNFAESSYNHREDAANDYDSNRSISASEIDFGSSNELVTKHVAWWTLVHTSFLPQMEVTARQFGWHESSLTITEYIGEDGKSHFTHDDEEQNMKAHGKRGPSRVKSESVATPTSELVKQGQLWGQRLKRDGILNVIVEPWRGFQPSPWEETYLPTQKIDDKGVQSALEEVMKRMDSDVKFMIDCIKYLNEISLLINVNTEYISNAINLSKSESRNLEEQEIAHEADQRFQVLNNQWDRWKPAPGSNVGAATTGRRNDNHRR